MMIKSSLLSIQTWHRAIFAGGCPPTIFAATAFHNRVRDGSEWVHRAIDTRKSLGSLQEETLKPAYEHSILKLLEIALVTRHSSLGQALGLLVRLNFKHYCSSIYRLLTGSLPVTLLG
jgi:hypothetical protein